MLSEEIKKRLLELVDEQEVNPKDLNSYRYNIYTDNEPTYSEDEYYSTQAEKLAKSIDYYGIDEYIPGLSEEEYNSEELYEEVFSFLRIL